ncbi:MAG: T9SS type A sorting domain-containing protein [Saprospiraceae bacterium]|nr:T9SS type A sorting domain-containing protein [Saprospiraceae bacterium]
MQLTPDGRIFESSGGYEFSGIPNPDRPGIECGGFADYVYLTVTNYNNGVPNYPNYRLGPVDGSACDTLGLDNLPQARFRYRNPYSNYAEFRNVSFGEPDAYVWDFGDPASGSDNSSTERNPVHTFSAAGTYTVCLTASNALGEQTRCQSVTVGIGLSHTNGIASEKEAYAIAPNPAKDVCRIICPATSAHVRQVVLYDANGKVVLEYVLSIMEGQHELSLENLLPGLYFLSVREDDKAVHTQKLVRLR